jgi:predicted DsbA family dithiol-disulfide isomerase
LGRAPDQEERVPQIVGELGLDLAKFQTCMEAEATLEWVRADRAEGNRLGVTSTPTFFINGRMVKGAAPLEALETMVDGLVASISK